MGFFDDVGDFFKDSGSAVFNEVVKPVYNEVVKPVVKIGVGIGGKILNGGGKVLDKGLDKLDRAGDAALDMANILKSPFFLIGAGILAVILIPQILSATRK